MVAKLQNWNLENLNLIVPVFVKEGREWFLRLCEEFGVDCMKVFFHILVVGEWQVGCGTAVTPATAANGKPRHSREGREWFLKLW
jgi:hypothetical protein